MKCRTWTCQWKRNTSMPDKSGSIPSHCSWCLQWPPSMYLSYVCFLTLIQTVQDRRDIPLLGTAVQPLLGPLPWWCHALQWWCPTGGWWSPLWGWCSSGPDCPGLPLTAHLQNITLTLHGGSLVWHHTPNIKQHDGSPSIAITLALLVLL